MADMRTQINYEIVDFYDNIYADPLIYAFSKFTNVFPLSSMNTYITQGNQAATLWSISYAAYGTIDWWWLVGMINGIDNALVPLQNAVTLYVPTITQLNQYKSAVAEMSSNINSNINPNYVGGTYAM